MKKINIIILLAIILLLSAGVVAAEQGMLRYGFFPKNGFNEETETQQRSGLGYEIMQHLAVYGGFRYEYAGYDKSWAQNVEMLERGEIDILPGAQISEDRREIFDFTLPLGYFNSILTTRCGNDKYVVGDYKNWNGIRVGMARSIIHNQHFATFAKEKGFNYTVVWFEDYKQLIEELQHGDKVDAIVSDSFRRLENEWVLAAFAQTPYRIMIKKGNAALLNKLNAAIEELNRHESGISRRLYEVYYPVANDQQLPFTLPERRFIEQARQDKSCFTAMINPNRAPFAYLEEGQLRGILKDISERIFVKTGLTFEWVVPADTATYQKILESNKIDVVMDFRGNYSQAEVWQYRRVLGYTPPAVSIMTRKKDFSNLKKVALLNDSELLNDVQRKYGNTVEFIFFNNSDAALAALKKGEVDGFYLYSTVADYILNNDMENQFEANVVPGIEANFSIAVSMRHAPELASILKQSLDSLEQREFDEIYERYFRTAPRSLSFNDYFYAHPVACVKILCSVLLLVIAGISGILYFRHRALNAMRQLNEQTNLLLEQRTTTLRSIGDGVIVTDRYLRITMLNQVASDLIGYSEAEVLGKTAGEVFKLENFDNHSSVEIPLKAAIEQNKIIHLQNHTDLVNRSGQRRQVADSASPIHDSKGNVVGGIMIIRDVTGDYERRERLDAALIMEQKLNAKLQNSSIIHDILLDNMPCRVIAKDIDNGMRYVLCNRSFRKIIGRDKADVLGRKDEEFFHNQEELASLKEFEREAIESDAPVKQVFKITDCNGMARWNRGHWVPLELSDGRRWLFVFWEDITEIENQRRECSNNAEYLRLTLNSIGDGVIATDEDGKITLMNPVAERMTGVKNESALGMPHEQVFKIVSAVDERPMSSPVTRSLRTGNIVELANHTDLLGANGKRYHIADSAAPILDDKRQITGAILVFRDVTEEYLQRDQLRDALNGLEYAAGLLHAAYFRMGFWDRRMMSYSAEFPDLWPIRDGKAVPPEEFVFSEDLAPNQKLFKDLLDGKCSEIVQNYRGHKNGEIKFYQIRAILDNSDRLNPAFVGVIQDVTELTCKERQLLDLVLGTIPVMIYAEEADNDFRFTIANQAFESFMGMSHDEVIGHNDYELLPNNRELADYLRKMDEEILRKNETHEFVEAVNDLNGRVHHLKTVKIPLRAADGRRLLLGVSTDITSETESHLELERLKAEQEDLLKQHEFILNAMPFLVYIQDAANEFRYTYCNNACAKSLGYEVDEIIGKNNYDLFKCRKNADLSLELCKKAMASNTMQEDVQILTDRQGHRAYWAGFPQMCHAFRRAALVVGDGGGRNRGNGIGQ